MPEALEYIEISFSRIEQAQREILVAKLSEAGFEGFEEVDSTLNAYVPATLFETKKLEPYLKELGIEYTINFIKDRNWNQLWETSFQPVYVGEKIMIRADFHEADKNVVHDIIITPQMSFGTGHHETTTMMIEAMCEVDCNGKTVLDFGTGTGILAIFAEKLGAEAVLAIDYDSWSISNANENISKNCCKRISLVQADRVPEGAKFDLVLSNINKNIILDSRRKFSGVLEENGVLIVSGFLDIDLEEVCSLFGSHFGKPHLILKKNNWVCLTFILERIEH